MLRPSSGQRLDKKIVKGHWLNQQLYPMHCLDIGLSTSSTRHVTNQCSHRNRQDGEVLGLAWRGVVAPNYSDGGTIIFCSVGVGQGLLTCLKLPLMLDDTHNLLIYGTTSRGQKICHVLVMSRYMYTYTLYLDEPY